MQLYWGLHIYVSYSKQVIQPGQVMHICNYSEINVSPVRNPLKLERDSSTNNHLHPRYTSCMMMSSNENIFRNTGPLWGETTIHRWIPLTKASDAELWSFL